MVPHASWPRIPGHQLDQEGDWGEAIEPEEWIQDRLPQWNIAGDANDGLGMKKTLQYDDLERFIAQCPP